MRVVPTPAVPAAAARPATVEEWLAIPEEQRAELIHGKIVRHAFPGPEHGFAQFGLGFHLGPYNRRTGGAGGGPGGWWLTHEVDMLIGGIGCRPDTVGWRREKQPRMPKPDARGVVTAEPDFIAEVISSSTARYDQGSKRDAYFKAGVTHYWLVDPTYKTLTVLERAAQGYMIVLVAGPGEVLRAPPFDLVEIPVAELFLDEEGGPPPEAAGEPVGGSSP
jgi:Uma2 family endonuclease